MLKEIFNKIDRQQELNKEDLIYLLSLEDYDSLSKLYEKADRIRQKYVGDEVHLRGLIEFSNICRKNCNYCGIRRDNRKIKRYRMEIKEILQTVLDAAKRGYKTVVLQSGEDMYYTVDKLTELIKQIKANTDVVIVLSIGERPKEEYKKLREAGAERFLLRFETSNPELYERHHPDSLYEERMQILKWLREFDYQVGSGVIIGLPGQTIEDLAMDILKYKELDLDMIGMGPYICHPDTPLAGNPNGSVEMALKMIAVTRIVMPDTNIAATTALGTLMPNGGLEKGLQVGANVIMPNITPVKYRKFYLLYPNKICIEEGRNKKIGADIHERIKSIGRVVSQGYGHSLRYLSRKLREKGD